MSDRGTFDFDQHDKLLQIVFEGTLINLVNKDYLKLRTLDWTLSFLLRSDAYLKSHRNASLIALTQEHSSLFPNLRLESKILSDYFQLEQTPLSQYLQTSFKSLRQFGADIVTQIWFLALRYLNYPTIASDQEMINSQTSVSKEAKGGVQLEIKFENEGAAVGKRTRKTAFKKVNFANDQQQQQQPSDSLDQVPQSSSKQINQISSRIITFITDVISIDKNPTTEQQALRFAFKKAYLSLNESDSFFTLMNDLKQIPALKRLLLNLLKKEDLSIRPKLQEKLYQSLIHMAGDAVSDRQETIVVTIEIAQLITDSNQQLLKFITEHVLGSLKKLDTSQEGNKLVMLVVLDFVC